MSAFMKQIDRMYALFLRAANSLQSPFLLAIRLYWGWQFWQTGWGKLSNISRPIEYFTSLGIPAPAFTAHFIGILEAGGGILLMLGLASRLIALPLVVDMIMAYVIADRDALHAIFSKQDDFYKADPFTFLFASLIILIFGPGWFSLDTIIKSQRAKRQKAASVSGS
jgi:putative oxidoreductase